MDISSESSQAPFWPYAIGTSGGGETVSPGPKPPLPATKAHGSMMELGAL